MVVVQETLVEDEVCKVIHGMDSDKALGPYGFTMNFFFQTCWEVIKGNLVRVFQKFHNHASLSSH